MDLMDLSTGLGPYRIVNISHIADRALARLVETPGGELALPGSNLDQ